MPDLMVRWHDLDGRAHIGRDLPLENVMDEDWEIVEVEWLPTYQHRNWQFAVNDIAYSYLGEPPSVSYTTPYASGPGTGSYIYTLPTATNSTNYNLTISTEGYINWLQQWEINRQDLDETQMPLMEDEQLERAREQVRVIREEHEQREEELRQARERNRQRRREEEAARLVAEDRALELLTMFLDSQQLECLNDNGYFEVEAEGNVFQINNRSRSGNINCVRGPLRGRNFCIHDRDYVPIPDLMLVQKAMIEGDYQRFLQVANY